MQARAAADSDPARLGEEERDDAVADVPADKAARVDDALVGRADQPAAEREVAGGREAPRERRGGLQVGEQDRRGAPRRPWRPAASARSAADRPSRSSPRASPCPPRASRSSRSRRAGRRRSRMRKPTTGTSTCIVREARRAPLRTDSAAGSAGESSIDHVAQRGVDDLAKLVAAARGVGEYPAAESGEQHAHKLRWCSSRSASAGSRSSPRARRCAHRCAQGASSTSPPKREAQLVSRVGDAPAVIDDPAPVSGVAQRRGHLGERRDPRAADTTLWRPSVATLP